MRFRLSPQDTAFYDLFTTAAENVREGVRVLSQALPVDSDRAALAARLKEVEHAGDDHTHNIIRRVNSTFVTPFDRDDIYRLASSLDDVLDDVEEAIDLMVLYNIGELPTGMAGMVDVLDQIGRAHV